MTHWAIWINSDSKTLEVFPWLCLQRLPWLEISHITLVSSRFLSYQIIFSPFHWVEETLNKLLHVFSSVVKFYTVSMHRTCCNWVHYCFFCKGRTCRKKEKKNGRNWTQGKRTGYQLHCWASSQNIQKLTILATTIAIYIFCNSIILCEKMCCFYQS